jgi:hypothetical protein
MKMVRYLLVTTTLFLGAACDTATGPATSTRIIGILEWQPATSGASLLGIADPAHTRISAPDTVDAGTPFNVGITTIGLSGCWNEDGAQSAVSGLLATVTPHDRVTTDIDGAPAFCTAALVELDRTVSLVFASAGTATLRVNGRVVVDGQVDNAQPLTVEKQIVVR